MDVKSIERQMDEIRWWHQIDLGDGIITPGAQDSQGKLELIHLPDRLDGQSVLDIGAWDGFFSFEAERRGATNVLAVDSPSAAWGRKSGGSGTGKRGFLFARSVLDSKVRDRDMEADDISIQSVGTFDTVLFLGIFYHLAFPFYCLTRIAALTTQRLIVETHTLEEGLPYSAMRFCPDGYNGDPTNRWFPNRRCIEEMLYAVGFNHVETFVNAKVPTARRIAFHGIR